MVYFRLEIFIKVIYYYDDDDFEEISSNSSDKSIWLYRRCYYGIVKRGEGRNLDLYELFTSYDISLVLL